MKRVRVLITTSVVVGLILFVFLVPVPLSRVRGVGLVEAKPETHSKMEVQYPGTLTTLNVRDGDRVIAGDVLAVFTNTEVESKLRKADRERTDARAKKQVFDLQLSETNRPEQVIKLEQGKKEAEKAYATARTEFQKWSEAKGLLTLNAPQSGVVSGLPSIEDVGKAFEKGAPFCTIIEPARCACCCPW